MTGRAPRSAHVDHACAVYHYACDGSGLWQAGILAIKRDHRRGKGLAILRGTRLYFVFAGDAEAVRRIASDPSGSSNVAPLRAPERICSGDISETGQDRSAEFETAVQDSDIVVGSVHQESR